MAMGMWPVTGQMDDNTVKAINSQDPKIVLAALDAAWIVWKHGQGPDGWKKYGHGWTNRFIKVRDRALAMMEQKS
jgi:lysozyme family protein